MIMKRIGLRILNICFLLTLAAGLLAGCAEIVTPSQPTIPSYTVTYLVNGQVHREQRLEEGKMPAAVDTSLQGIQVLGGREGAQALDRFGQVVRRAARPVSIPRWPPGTSS